MQKNNSTVQLLILDPSQNDAESLVSLLRNSGKATRAHRITSEEDLEEALKASHWDLMLGRDLEELEFGPDAALAMVKRMDKDIPFILLTNEPDRERDLAIMRLGAQDAVPFENTEMLVLTIKRELTALYERRKRRVLESHLREAEQRCQLLLESSKDAIAYINDGMHIYANQSYMDFLGYEDIDDLICVPVLDTLNQESQEQYKEFMKAFEEAGANGMTLNCTARRSDDHELNVTMSASAATYDGEACTQVVLQPEHSDEELEEKLKQISSQDLLTGLYNRQYLMEQLAQTLASAAKNNETGALAYIGIDNFLSMKGDVGIAGADLLLGDLASLLKEHTPEGLTLARLSDDAFCVMSLPCSDKELAELCETLRKVVDDHLFEINGRTISLSVSIGVSAITENSPKAEELLSRVHLASAEVRKQANHKNGNGVVVYNPVDFEVPDESNAIEVISKAMDEDRLHLLFQPIINLRGEGEEHYEALARMINSDNEEVTPYDLLPAICPPETAIKIDRWVTLQSIKQLSSHRSRGHDTRLFVNLSAETFQDVTFSPWLSVALKAARLPGDALIFQINENDANNFMKQAKEFTKAVHELNCKISIKHFGCAINPFNALKHIDTDYVKFDGSFTETVQKDDKIKEQVKEMTTSLQNSGKLTIVPQVENASILATLWQAGVNYIQGYYLQAPTREMSYDFGDH
ncbi:EAL domain-containing protein [Marinobacter sp.]|uniref:EAL domain-containing response regulator n=1 Tax=Marinobacter sp. TaxID=50741 RepID=UPI002B267632|nr:EAL domain-containing protein [Marinobacter sp.]